MVLGWFQTPMSRDRANSLTNSDNARREEQPAPQPEMPQQQPEQPQPERRRSIFERRVSLGSDSFSREYADQMEDMWVAECEQGDCAHVSKGHLRTEALMRPVPLGTDEFSREYFDSTEDTFVAETDLGDSGFLRRNSQTTTDMEAPDIIRRLGELLRKPIHVGHDTFSQEYAREGADMWEAKAGKGPSGNYRPGIVMERVMNEQSDWNKMHGLGEEARRRSISGI